MKVVLLHNPTAGNGGPRPIELEQLLREAGHDVVYQSTKARRFADVLDTQRPDLVVVAGGDGSVAKVVREMAGRALPLAVLPLGTANNIARSLGIDGTPEELVRGWPEARLAPFDVGIARGPWGRACFVEGIGIGAFTEAMCLADSRDRHDASSAADEGRRFERDFRLLRRVAASMPGDPSRITIDDEEFDAPMLLCEVLNIRSLGSQLVLADGADPGDGQLDVVLLTEDQRDLLRAYLDTSHPGVAGTPPLPVRRARRVRVVSHAARVHLDDGIETVEPAPAAGGWALEVSVDAAAVTVLVPRARDA